MGILKCVVQRRPIGGQRHRPGCLINIICVPAWAVQIARAHCTALLHYCMPLLPAAAAASVVAAVAAAAAAPTWRLPALPPRVPCAVWHHAADAPRRHARHAHVRHRCALQGSMQVVSQAPGAGLHRCVLPASQGPCCAKPRRAVHGVPCLAALRVVVLCLALLCLAVSCCAVLCIVPCSALLLDTPCCAVLCCAVMPVSACRAAHLQEPSTPSKSPSQR